MKTLQSISQTLKQWQNHHHYEFTPSQNNSSSKQYQSELKDSQKPSWFRLICKVHSPVMLVLTITSLTGVVSNRFYSQPELAVGTISPIKIMAPRGGEFVDEKSTEELRRKNRNGLIPVLKQDENITQIIQLKLLKQLTQIEEIRKIRGDFPYF